MSRQTKEEQLQEVSNRNFGLLIAYLIPGLMALAGVSFISPAVSVWLSGSGADGPTIGGFLYVTLASLGCGMTANALRWVIVDGLHHLTGLRRPQWRDETLADRFTGYAWLVENHYRYYQCYANLLVSTAFAYGLWRTSHDLGDGIRWIDASMLGLLAVFFASSRSALRHYYSRAVGLLGQIKESEMNGGRHPKEEKPKKNEAKPEKKERAKPKKTKSS